MSDRATRWCVCAALALPFVVALAVLAGHHWVPVLDLAMTELRVRDVGGRHTPLIGLPGRIGRFPDQGSHPGPLSFYVLAPVYRVFGGTAFGLLTGAAVVNVGAAWSAVWLAGRRGGRRLLLGVGAYLMVVTAWFGASVLTQPWNPYLPLVSFVAALLAAWGVLDGDHVLLVPLVAFSSLCAQTHVPYLSLCVAICAAAIGVVVWRWWRRRSIDRGEARSAVLAVVLAAALWLPVLVDEVRRTPGNITMLRRHFLSPPEPPVGLRVGVTTVLRHFDLTRVLAGTVTRSADHLASVDGTTVGSSAIGAVVLAAWLVAAFASRRLPDRRIRQLHVVVAIGTAVGLLSTSRIFGRVWYYLTLWSWSLALLAAFATVWTAVAWYERTNTRPLPVAQVSIGLAVLAGVCFVRDAAHVDPPEERLSRVLDHVVAPTARALADGIGAATGRDGTYAVVWEDAYYFGSQGYGLVNELERRGFDARGYSTFRVPLTPQRITNASLATAEVVLVTGAYIDGWRDRPDVVEVAFFEPRSPDELAEFERLHDDAVRRLDAAGLGDVAALVDTNLFGARLDPRVPPAVERMLVRMLVLGEATAVFLAPPGTI